MVVGQAEGAEVGLDEDELLSGLRATGMITYPSPLLGGLLEDLPEVLVAEVLRRLDPTALTMLAQVGRPWLAAVLASELPRLSKGVRVRLQLEGFCTSVERLAWAKANGCMWGEPTYDGWIWQNNPCALAAAGGRLAVLRWAREHGCAWRKQTWE